MKSDKENVNGILSGKWIITSKTTWKRESEHSVGK